MAKLVTIFGGAGFVGRYIARRMAKDGWRVRVAVRRPNEALHVKPYGVVGQVEPIFANIRDDASVRAAISGADAVVNCVGTFDAKGPNNFDAVMHEGAGRIARIASELGATQFVHISAIGADPEGNSLYARAKGKGEAAILAAFPGAVILRPSVIFGPEDQFFNRFAGMPGPVLPVAGGHTKFQPVYVDDVARAACLGIEGEAEAGIYELGGPDVESFADLMHVMLGIIRRRKLVLNLPFWAARAIAFFGGIGQAMSLGAIKSPITSDQVESLRSDNVVSEGAMGFSELGLQPQAMEAILPDYLWRFRPSGQYNDIKALAENLRRDGQL